MHVQVEPVFGIFSNASFDDLTVYDVPEDCVGFVMGRSGATLRSLEEEWGTLMFFARTDDRSQRSDEKLCIFGGLRARRGAELKVMSVVEHKHPGYCVNSRGELREIERVKGDDDDSGSPGPPPPIRPFDRAE